MRRLSFRAILPALLILLFTLGLAACGNDNEGGGGGQTASDFPPPTAAPDDAKKGGTLTLVGSGDVDYIDPGAGYYQATYIVDYPTQRALMGWPPDEAKSPQPDLADGQPQVSDDFKTVTVKIKRGIHYSPPVNREVKAQDFKYAIERGLLPGVANGYFKSYAPLVGYDQAEAAVAKNDSVAPNISGITTPDDHTLVLKLSKPASATTVQALSLPIGSPVPEEYAKPFDAESPSGYGSHVVSTGPYMIENDSSGKLTGYSPGKSITLVRNPNWDPSTDYRPAYLDRIEVQEGFTDVNSAVRKVLTGDSQSLFDILPEPAGFKLAATQYPDQLGLVAGSGDRYIAMNTQKPPFNDINVRKAVVAGFDRTAVRLARGGPLAGYIPTHFIFPLVPGFDESGGHKGFGFDFLSSPSGNSAVSAKYFRKAGFSSGKYDGPPITMVGENAGVDKQVTEVVRSEFANLGFKVDLKEVSSDTMYTKFCNVPANMPDVCPTVGWIADFKDPQAVLDVPFNGEIIQPTNNYNWPLLNVPAINKAIDTGRYVSDPSKRPQFWANINRMITAQAPAIPYNWDTQPTVWSSNVNAVLNLNNATIDPSFTSLKNP